MANLPESSTFDAGVYQLETTDPVIGGPSGISNTPLKNLANRTKYLKDQVDSLASTKAPLASPALTGTPTAPTAAAGTNTTQLATTAFVQQEITGDLATATPLMAGTAAVGTSNKLAREDHRHPTDTTRAPLASPAFTGNPTAPTPAQFDNDTSIATTEFVQRALGNFRTYTGLSGNNTLAVNEGGAFFELTSGSTGTTTLPSAVGRAGLSYFFNNTSAYRQTIAATAPSAIYGAGASGASTFSIPAGTQYEFVSDGGNWKVINYGGIFNLSGNGYQKLPSGLIIQWGEVGISNNNLNYFNLPIAFPNSILSVSAIMKATRDMVLTTSYSNSTTQIGLRTGASGVVDNALYIAIGY